MSAAPRMLARRLTMLAACAVLAAFATEARGVTHLKRGMAAPPIALDTIHGTSLSLEDLRGQPMVLVFGELYHEKTLQACGDVRELLASDAFAGEIITPVLIVAHEAPREELRRQASDPRVPRKVLLDDRRKAYGEYRVSVMPSCVVIDAEGRVVHATAGATARLRDTLADAMLMAVGELSPEDFDHRRQPDPEAIDEAVVRATRIANLARQLVRRGLDDLAKDKYAEAIALAPDHVPARLGLGMLLLERRQLAAAEIEFRAALAVDPVSTEALLGLAYVQILRGGDELADAEKILRGMLVANAEEARAHYLMGLVRQQRGDAEGATAAFRKAAELLMSRRDTWNIIPGKHDDERASPDQPR